MNLRELARRVKHLFPPRCSTSKSIQSPYDAFSHPPERYFVISLSRFVPDCVIPLVNGEFAETPGSPVISIALPENAPFALRNGFLVIPDLVMPVHGLVGSLRAGLTGTGMVKMNLRVLRQIDRVVGGSCDQFGNRLGEFAQRHRYSKRASLNHQ